jgi:hypothetical protein
MNLLRNRRHDTQHNETQPIDTQHNNKNATLSIMTLNIRVLDTAKPSVVLSWVSFMLNVICAECRK